MPAEFGPNITMVATAHMKMSRQWLHCTFKNGQCFDVTLVASIFDRILQKGLSRWKRNHGLLCKVARSETQIGIQPVTKTQNLGCIPQACGCEYREMVVVLAGWRLPHSLQNLSLKSGLVRLDLWWGSDGVPEEQANQCFHPGWSHVFWFLTPQTVS